ncbi:MAG TPA: carboxypeptidase-like regulatory domain-containing protein, partial [Myxococcaceae bacterium]|nr:carboxypeptidase-like regulatory domain-containing protein [Myxococcaceae bacterium]
MNLRSSLVTILLVPSLTLAQVDERNTFPPVLNGGGQTKPQPRRNDKRDSTRISLAAPPTVVAAPSSVTEPHSPSTVGYTLNASGNWRITSGPVGSTGLIHTSSAALGPEGIVRLGATGEYFTRENFPLYGAANVRTAGTFSLSYVATPWLETYAAYSASANTNSSTSPTLIQALGDVTLGAKLTRPWIPGLFAGVDVRLQSFPGVGTQDVRNYAWGFGPRLVGTYDVRTIEPRLPLLAHLNAGIQLDSTVGLVPNRPLSLVEEFALGVNRYNRFIAAAGVEAPLPLATPYLEYAVAVPLDVPDGRVAIPGGGTVPVGDAMPQTLGAGVRVTAVRDLTLTVGADFSLAKTSAYGIAATPPWNLFVGAAFNVEPFAGEGARFHDGAGKSGPSYARVAGIVLDARTRRPLSGATVDIVDTNTPPVTSDAEGGRFVTDEAAPGPVTIRAWKPGYRIATQSVILRPGQTATVQLTLAALPKSSPHLMVSVTGAGRKKLPVPAEVRLKGPMAESVRLPAQSTEPSRIDIPPGKYVINVLAPEHLAQTREVQLAANDEVTLAFELQPEPRPRLLVVRDGRIVVFEQVQFADGSATILPASYT